MHHKKSLMTIKFTGGRYADGSLDTDAMKSIIALEKCIGLIAINLWKEDHPGERLPRGFKKQIEDSIKFKIRSADDVQ